MDEPEKLYLVAGALVLGFVDLGNDEFKCTKEQLCQLAVVIATAAIEQFIIAP